MTIKLPCGRWAALWALAIAMVSQLACVSEDDVAPIVSDGSVANDDQSLPEVNAPADGVAAETAADAMRTGDASAEERTDVFADAPEGSQEAVASKDVTEPDGGPEADGDALAVASADVVVDVVTDRVDEAHPQADQGADGSTLDADGPTSDADGAFFDGREIDADAIGEANTNVQDGVSVEAESGDASSADADAGPDTPSARVIRSARGDSCLNCAIMNGCIGTGSDDCESIGSSIGDGPDAGALRQQACRDTLRCVLVSRCEPTPPAAPDLGNGLACYCGTVSFGTCVTDPGDGPCRTEEEVALESTDPITILGRFLDSSYAGGAANLTALCLNDDCASFCFP
jgi:hypothetical protein